MADSVEKIRVALNATHVDDDIVLRVVKTCEEMLRDRGCQWVEVADTAEIAERVEQEQPVLVGGPNPSTRIIIVKDERVSVKTIREHMEGVDAYDRTIFISSDGPTAFAKKEAMTEWGRSIQFFKYKEVVHNITKHQLVPKHTKVDPPTQDATSYPHILTTDPVCQYYDFEVGDVVHILRKRGSVKPFAYYRTVVAPTV